MNRRVLLALAAIAVLATGCGAGEFSGAYRIPLPGGADIGDHPYHVTARFKDVLDLVPQAGVKVNDVPVGRVEKVSVAPGGWSAEVSMVVNGTVRLPADATANLRQSSLLGEKYVELVAPPGSTSQKQLADGAVIPLERTNRNPQIEEVLGALSMVLNGGGIGQLQTITRELNKALSGNEGEVRDLLSRIDTLVSDLDKHKGDIVKALDGMNKLAATLNGRGEQITGVLKDLTPGVQVLSQQREALTGMLTALGRLSSVAVDTVNRSKDDLVADLRALAPTLQQLSAAGDALPNALQVLVTYPFTDAVLDGIKGDYLNVYLKMDAGPGVNTAAQSGIALPLGGGN
ncbi:MCE family protein [Kutzneria albida]|uniref:Virulence factor Mce family protein n=1 Tax=Kutzneria albida DSM 43870 TaxID=1449976 RepID=W5WEP8_9PSEU|nr:MCE family protein [Kutzneria albida]AHH99668.1 hypothetical protein KALB_6308 [Kutzneria albida DSM 43870]